jgi:hypothetical protein
VKAMGPMLRTWPAVGLALLLFPSVSPAAECCALCGSTSGLRRVCRPVLAVKPTEFTVWEAACEEFCLPRRGMPLTHAQEGDAGETCGAESDGASAGADSFRRQCTVHTRNKLMRKTFVQEVPVIVWQVEYVCQDCAPQPPPQPKPPERTGLLPQIETSCQRLARILEDVIR